MRKENVVLTCLALLLVLGIGTMILSTFLSKDPKEEQVVEYTPGEPVHLETGEYEIWMRGWINPEIRIENMDGEGVDFEEGGYYIGNSKDQYMGSFSIEYEGNYTIQTEGPSAELYITHELPRYPYTLCCWSSIFSVFILVTTLIWIVIIIIKRRKQDNSP